jgi:hypothetical protein
MERVSGEPALQVRFTGESGEWTCLAVAREQQRQFVFYSVLDGFVEADQRPAVQEFLTRANWTLAIGNFEFNPDTGEVRYKTSVDLGEEHLTSNLAQRVVYANVINMDRYLPALLAVCAGELSPADALQSAEGVTPV